MSSLHGPFTAGRIQSIKQDRRSEEDSVNLHKTAWFTLAALLNVSGMTLAAQFGGRGMMQQAPPMAGAFKPTVGAGSEFQLTSKERSINFTVLVVDKETVDGADGYWMEQRFEGSGMPGEMVQKQLVVIQDGKPDIKRMIMQPPGQQPMEMPVGMVRGGMEHARGAEGADPGEQLGTERVTVPAGTFECEHYRKQTQHGTYDYWISPKVTPYPIVKMTGPDTTMVLVKVLSGESSHIHGEPRQMPGFPGVPH
jgi:hypothetical protein